MKIKFAPSFLLSVLCCPNEGVAAFNTVRPVSVASVASSYRPSSAISMTNDFDAHYNVDVDRRGNIQNIAASEFNRRDALARFAAFTTAAASATFLGGNPAFAADTPAPAVFSESPTSEASIARMGYDGKGAPPVEAPPPAEAVELAAAPPVEEAAKEQVVPKKKEDFDGNEAGSVGNGDGASWKKRAAIDPKLSISKLNLPVSELISEEDYPKLVGGAVAFVALTAIANGDDEEGKPKPNPLAKGAPPATPYGLSGGRNYWEGVDMTAAKQAGLVAPAPPTPPPEPKVEEPEPAKVEAAAAAPTNKPKWKLDAPTPYGLQNKDGKNPFIKNVMEYCEGGKVTAPCTETIKGYLDEIADSGAVATKGEVKAIVGYLDALGSDGAPSAIGGGPGAAFASYLDALSEGSAPPPSSAKAVKTYLDTLKGTGDGSSAAESMQQEPAAVAPKQSVAPEAAVVAAFEPTPEPAAVAAPTSPDFSVYDNRLTNIEDRVTSLESKVDELPDKVFEKIEAWQTQHEGRLTEEVKKIVSALAPPAPPAEPVAVVEAPPPFPEPEVVIPEPEPVVAPVATAPIVQATPLAAAVPERPSMPMAGSANVRGYAKEAYGLGGGAGWKTGKPSSSSGGGYLDNMSP